MKYRLLSFGMVVLGFTSCDFTSKDKMPDDIIEATDSTSQVEEEIPTRGHLTVLDVAKGTSFVAFESDMHFESPNWLRDNTGDYLIFNSEGEIYKIKLYSDGLPEIIPTYFANDCNSGHVLSPSRDRIGISHHLKKDHTSKIYTLPIKGGKPKLVTKKGSSYLHGWSPDGSKLTYCGERGGEYDIYTIDTTGKNETRLTFAAGLDDGPEYSPDGKYIYFNSNRTDTMQIWRMNADGSDQIQITNDGHSDWFPHVSPNGKYIVFVSYDANVSRYPHNEDVEIRIMNTSDFKIRSLHKVFGGQGTMNVASWSPDSKKIAFVRYEPLVLN